MFKCLFGCDNLEEIKEDRLTGVNSAYCRDCKTLYVDDVYYPKYNENVIKDSIFNPYFKYYQINKIKPFSKLRRKRYETI